MTGESDGAGLWDLLSAPEPNVALNALGQQPPSPGRYFDGTPITLVTRYEDVKSVLNDSRLVNELPPEVRAAMAEAVGLPAEVQPYFLHSLLTSDPPDHTRLRKLVSQAFAARRIERLEPVLTELAERLIGELGPERETDLLARFAYPFSSTAICDLLGIPAGERDKWTGWTWVINDPTTGTPEQVAEAARGLLEYATRLVELRRREPGDDLISGLVRARDGSDRLSDAELVTMVFTLIGGGAETTAYLIGNAMYALLTLPAQRQLVEKDPANIPAMVEEVLRHNGPAVIGATLRFATEPITVGGVSIPAGGAVQVVFSSANHDPAQFEGPERFDPLRTDNAHLGFGHGMHFCLGSALARLETRIAIDLLLRHFPRMELAIAPQDVRWRPAGVRGPDRLPVTLVP